MRPSDVAAWLLKANRKESAPCGVWEFHAKSYDVKTRYHQDWSATDEDDFVMGGEIQPVYPVEKISVKLK